MESKNRNSARMALNTRFITGVIGAAALVLMATVCIFSCKKSDSPGKTVAGATNLKVNGSQPLPGGKANFSVCIGHLATTGARWVRMQNLTFSLDGTVDATFWHWDNTLMKGKTAFNTHTCTWTGSTSTCTTYVPTGWMVPGGQHYSLTGTYTYNPTTHALAIAWSGGTSENWLVSNPTTALARIVLVSSGGTGYAITHGRGYGSNASWGTYKTIAQIPRIVYSGYNIICTNVQGASTNTLTNGGAWDNNSLDLSTSTTPSSPSPANALHFYTQGGSGCQGNPRTGNVYHLASNNNGRSMSYTHWRACLEQGTWPCYNSQLHPYAYQQIIDDNGDFKGFVGIEQQDEPPVPPATQNNDEYQLIDYTTVP